MMQPLTLRGMTWSDPRGHDPMVAAAAGFAALEPGVSITWAIRSLQGFESTPVEELAETHDLMVIDHPHVGAAARAGCLLPLDLHAPSMGLARLQAETVGKSYASYTIDGRQWALPIDAAAQVQATRPDLIPGPLPRWDAVLDLAREGRVLWPLRPPHGLMSFFTLCANLGDACAVTPGPLVTRPTGRRVLQAMQALARAVDPACMEMDPIAALNALASGSRHALVPLTYMYTPYARDGYRAHPIAFHDIPALGANGPLGSALGGTGIAISARTAHPQLCTRFALWLAGAGVQASLYAAHNGQPGNARAWGDDAVNAACGQAYRQTRMTHEAAWLRPRHAGYMAFQDAAARHLTTALARGADPDATLDTLDHLFAESFAA